MRTEFFLPPLVLALVIAAIFAIWPAFGAPWVPNGDEGVSLLTPEGECQQARLWREILEDPRYRERVITSGVASMRAYRGDMTEAELRRAGEVSYDASISYNSAKIEFWCSRE